MSARTDIAAAASTVAGINVTPYYRQALKPGNGFVRFDSMAPDEDGDQIVTWQVWIAAPTDLVTAEKWVETNAPLLLAALKRQFLSITSLSPQELILGDQITNGIVIAGTREAD